MSLDGTEFFLRWPPMSKKRFCWFDFKKNKLLLDINWAEYYELWCSNLTVTLIRLETDYSYFQIVKTVYLLWLTPTNETILFCCHGIFPMKSQWRTTITWKGELNFFTIGLFFKWTVIIMDVFAHGIQFICWNIQLRWLYMTLKLVKQIRFFLKSRYSPMTIY